MTLELGTVIAPSGTLLIVDPGYLKMWTHDRPPVMPEGILSDAESTARANRAVDLTLVGRDAERVGRKLDRQWHPRFLFDVPRDMVDDLVLQIGELAAAEGLEAGLAVVPERVTHRRRVALALEQGQGAGEVMFHGVWAAVITGLPTGALPVLGELMPADGPDARRLRRVTIVARPGPFASSERFAYVGVDWARLLAVDVDALAGWQDSEPLDGKADFAFWGVDAAFATDFRPHSHHYVLMEQVRSSPTESGVVSLGEARACGFTTRWGDGIFEVHRDLDAEGRVVQIRIELGTEQRQKLMRKMELRWSTSALVSRKIVDDGEPIRFMYREAADRDVDSGWRMMSGLEDDAYDESPENIAVVPLTAFANRDERVDALLDEPVGSAFERRPGQQEFERVTDWEPPGRS